MKPTQRVRVISAHVCDSADNGVLNDPRLHPLIRNFYKAAPLPDDGSADEVPKDRAEQIKFIRKLDSEYMTFANNPAILHTIQTGAVNHWITSVESISPVDKHAKPYGEIELHVYSPAAGGPFPVVIWAHGGGMAIGYAAQASSHAVGYLLAKKGLVVVMPEFTNSTMEPFPRGLHDCFSAVRWAYDNQRLLNCTAQLVVAGPSGGGNLCIATSLLAKQVGFHGIRGTYALCPYIRGVYPAADCPSHKCFDWPGTPGLDITAKIYTVTDEDQKNPLAWPSLATKQDLAGLPPLVVSVNELDPLYDEGVSFCRNALEAGVKARCVVRMGTGHGMDMNFMIVPDITDATYADIASFAASR